MLFIQGISSATPPKATNRRCFHFGRHNADGRRHLSSGLLCHAAVKWVYSRNCMTSCLCITECAHCHAHVKRPRRRNGTSSSGVVTRCDWGDLPSKDLRGEECLQYISMNKVEPGERQRDRPHILDPGSIVGDSDQSCRCSLVASEEIQRHA